MHEKSNSQTFYLDSSFDHVTIMSHQVLLKTGTAYVVTPESIIIANINPKGSTKTNLAFKSTGKTRGLKVSKSEKYLMISDDDTLHIYDLVVKKQIAELEFQNLIDYIFVRYHGEEYVCAVSDRYSLDCYSLPDIQKKFTHSSYTYPAFIFEQLVSFEHSDLLIAIGCFFSETKSSLVTFSFDKLLNPENGLAACFNGERDYAYQLAVGYYTQNECIVFRDPEEDEEDVEKTGPEDQITLPSGILNLKGFYIMDIVSGSIKERIPFTLKGLHGSEMFGNESSIVFSCPDGIGVLDKTSNDFLMIQTENGQVNTNDKIISCFDFNNSENKLIVYKYE